MLVTIRGKRWRLVSMPLKGAWGNCTPPDQPNKQIRLSAEITTAEGLIEIALHEILHAAQWDLDETAVEEIARDMARILTRMGTSVDVAAVHERLRGQS